MQRFRDCNESCNDRYGVLDIPWRVYCKKACSSEGESWDDSAGAHINWDKSSGFWMSEEDNPEWGGDIGFTWIQRGVSIRCLGYQVELGKADCKNKCHKVPVFKEYEWSAHLDRSPGSPTMSRKCEKACIRGCAFKFHITAAEVASALPRKPPPPPEDQNQPVVAPITTIDQQPPISA